MNKKIPRSYRQSGITMIKCASEIMQVLNVVESYDSVIICIMCE